MSELIRGFIQRNFTFLVGQHQQHLLLRELHCNKQNDENHEMFFTYHFESVTKLSSGEINLFNFNETALKHSLSPKITVSSKLCTGEMGVICLQLPLTNKEIKPIYSIKGSNGQMTQTLCYLTWYHPLAPHSLCNMILTPRIAISWPGQAELLNIWLPYLHQ